MRNTKKILLCYLIHQDGRMSFPARFVLFLHVCLNKLVFLVGQHVCMYVYIYIYTCIYIYICMYIYVCMYVCMYMHVYVCMYICTHAYMYKHVCVYVYSTHICTYMYFVMSIYYYNLQSNCGKFSTVFNGVLYQITTGTPSEWFPPLWQVALQ